MRTSITYQVACIKHELQRTPYKCEALGMVLDTYCLILNTRDMDSLSQLLKGQQPAEPPQITAIKQYALDTHGLSISVFSSARSYLIKVPNGAIAHNFRLETAHIMKVCNLDKPLVIHIG